MHQQCTGCHVSLRATKPGSFVLRCPRCGRRFAAKLATPNAPALDRYDASGASDLDVRPFSTLFDHTPDPFSGRADDGASMLDSTPDPSTADSGGSDAGFGGGGGFDGGGSSGDF